MHVMDIHESFSFIEIVHWSTEQLDAALRARTSTWRHLVEGEAELYGSMTALVERLRHAGNRQFLPPFAYYGRVRDEWEDA